MIGMQKVLVLSMFLLLGSFGVAALPGCQADDGIAATTRPSVAGEDRAVMCDKCKTVWVMRSGTTSKGMITYSRKPKMVCSECSSSDASFFATGKIADTCKSCGGSLEPCQGQRQ